MLRYSLLPLHNVLIDRTHHRFEPPLRPASGAVAVLVENAGNRAQAVANRSQSANGGESRLLGWV